MRRGNVVRRLLGLLRPQAGLMAVSSACRIANQTLGVAIPAVAAVAVAGIAIGQTSGVWVMVGWLVLMAVVKGAFRYLEQYTGHAVAFSLLADLRADTYRRIEPLAPAGLEDERSGDLVARVVGDVDRVEPFYAHTIAPLIGSVFVPLLSIGGLAIFGDAVTTLALAPFPLAIVIVPPWLHARRVAALSSDLRTLSGEAAAMLTDAVQGSREIAVLAAEPLIADRIEGRSLASQGVRSRLAGLGSVRSGLSDLLAGGAVIVTTLVAAVRFDQGAISLPVLAAAVAVAWVVTGPARALEEIVPDLEQALASAARLFELSDRRPPVTEPDGDLAHPADGSIRYEAVSVRLGGEGTVALDDVDLEIPDGGVVAIVGPSGSGKSTLVELLVRFRDPDEGRVLVGGSDVRRIPLSELRSQVALVSQRPELFFGTVRDNLLLAKPDATDPELLEALEKAALGDWAASLSNALDTAIGELGDTLSGGQRQRLALTRGLLRDARIMVLDEATSELDAEAARRVQDTIEAERGRRTIVIVAHRLETVTDADLLVVLDRGRLVETGTHHELVTAGGMYAGLWQRHLDMIEE
ncbi:MAG: ABC transporter ATP-binding protein/permease [Actinobacteria bacterium]|nr:ABC transporter ATP-binding protein/permease [Actinomycetota bacterium]MBU1492829.1 ABC transporter ATP-binding protein/permease [Actinomycetota bacterium]